MPCRQLMEPPLLLKVIQFWGKILGKDQHANKRIEVLPMSEPTFTTIWHEERDYFIAQR